MKSLDPKGDHNNNNNNNNNNNKVPTVIHNSTPIISNRVVKSISTTAVVDKQLSIKPLAEEEETAEQEQEQDISSMKEIAT